MDGRKIRPRPSRRLFEFRAVEVQEEFKKIPDNPCLRLVRTFPPQNCPRKDIMCVAKTGPIDVYEVVAGPIKPAIEEQ